MGPLFLRMETLNACLASGRAAYLGAREGGEEKEGGMTVRVFLQRVCTLRTRLTRLRTQSLANWNKYVSDAMLSFTFISIAILAVISKSY